VRRALAIIVALSALGTGAYDESQVKHEMHPHLARMLHQNRATPYDETSAFPDGKVMQAPPDDAVPHALPEPPYMVNGAYVERIPIPVTPALLARGEDRFDVTCAACHGILGDGDSVVATKMESRKPRSLHDEGVRKCPPGRLYEVILRGYGLMPSYAELLQSPADRWAVVAYVRALQLSQHAPVADLPKDLVDDLARSPR